MSHNLTFLANAATAANAVVPVTGNNYLVQGFGFSHWLDNNNSASNDGNAILAWHQNSPETANQEWTFLTYPTSDGSTVFSLQSDSTVAQLDPSFGGRGGYVSVDSSTGGLVQKGEPFAWNLVSLGSGISGIYEFSPSDDLYSDGGSLVVTDQSQAIISPSENQAILQPNTQSIEQFWLFNAI